MHIGVLVNDDEGALKLTHVFRVDAEISLQRNIHVHSLWHVNEGATRPHGGVQRGELIIARGNDGTEILLEELWVITQRGVGIDEDNALAF